MKIKLTRSTLLIGGRDAGKSNYLFRLWLGIADGKGLLVKDGLPDALEYLRVGSEEILQGKFAERTAPTSLEIISIPIKSRFADDFRAHLVVPDAPGEQILKIYKSRQWSETWENHVADGCSCLFFIRADSKENIAPLDWATCFDKMGAHIDEHQQDGEPDTPTQAVLTDWLQLLRAAYTSAISGEFRPRIGIIVSAWDAVPNEQRILGPADWIQANFPMLGQFIRSNGDQFEFEIFGLSIVAGDFNSDEDFKKRFSEGRPQDFGEVCYSLAGHLDTTTDVTLPVAWSLGFPLKSQAT